MAIVFVGIDLAKNVFAVHGVNEAGRPELVRPTVPRARLQELIATLAPCTIDKEARSGARPRGTASADCWPSLGIVLPRTAATMRREAPVHDASRRTKNRSKHCRVTASVDASRPDLCGERLSNSRRRHWPRLTIAAPARVLHQGPQP